jgi:uncharacterized SAM-binding protein YcdF (DUF218 family)/glycosyltransferase involved in cell wall biosynthesis
MTSVGRDILCISSIDWDFIWQGHQEIMATLVDQGDRVLFVENTGVRSPQLRDLPRLGQRLRNWWRGIRGFRQERENLFVYSPLILPIPYSRVARRINRPILLRALRRWMLATGFRRPIIWVFLPTPLARELIRELDPALTIYYCIDDLASSSRQAKKISRSETQLFREVDLVFVTSEKLRDRAARFSDHVHLFPFGVNYRKFEQVRMGFDEVPADLRGIPRPVAGYVGGVHRWVDQSLLASVAERIPEVSFAFVGPTQTDVSQLAGCPNVHLLGARPHMEVPGYIKGFDVGLVPYRLSDYTTHVYPTKLNEYLAMGIPVVATDIPEIRRFNAEHGEVVAVARDAEAFAEAIREAIEKTSPTEASRRIEVARQNSWEGRIGRMSVLIEEALRARREAEERWEESLRRLYRRARRRIIRTVAGIVATYFLLFYSPFVWFVAEPLRVLEPSRRVDAIVVFAGGVGESGKAGGGYQERVKQAVDFYHEGKSPRLIFSSGYAFALREAEVMRDLAVSLGVPASAIILEEKSGSTFENVVFVRDILRREGLREILLVSSPYHMRRALLTWRKAAPDVRVTPTPVPHSQFYAHDLGANLEQMRGILHEYVAIVYYWWKGWI